MLEFLIRNLEQRNSLSETEKKVLHGLRWRQFSFRAGDELVAEADEPESSNLLISGLVGRVRHVTTGKRQILALHVPGDFIDLQSFLLKEMDHSLVAMAAGQIAAVAHSELTVLCNEHPRLGRLLWRLTLVDAAIHREWMLGLGRLDAAQRAAHLMCELYVRLEKVKLAKDYRFELGLSQLDLSDLLGLSAVHVNRTLQELRTRNLITLAGRTVSISDWKELAALAEFDDRYLHYEHKPIA